MILMRKTLLLTLISSFLFIQCSKDEEPSTPAGTGLAAFKTALMDNHNIANLITDISVNADDQIVVDYEDGTQVTGKSSFAPSYSIDSIEWRGDFNFSDNSRGSYYALGASLGMSASDLTLNPSGLSPLTGKLNYTSPVPGQFTITIKGQDGPNSDYRNAYNDFGTNHEVPVYGLYENHSNEVTFTFTNGDGLPRRSFTMSAVTDDIADSLFSATVVMNNLPAEDQSFLFLSAANAAIDNYGRIRWYYTGGEAGAILRKNSKGNLIGISSQSSANNYHGDHFLELDLFGNVINKIALPNLVHHDVWEMPNGNYLIGTSTTFPDFNDGNPDEDLIVELDPATGNIVKEWDLNQIMDPNRPSFDVTGTRPDDWNHNNSIKYYEQDNSILISCRNQNAVLSIDYTTSEINWILGIPVNWENQFQSKLLSPTNIADSAAWFWMQHAPVFKQNGDLVLFDNGLNRTVLTNETVDYSRAVTYSIDENSMEVTQVSEYGKNRPSIYSRIMGDVDELFFNDQSHIMITFSMSRTIVIIDDSNNEVFEVTTSSPNYRSEKINLY